MPRSSEDRIQPNRFARRTLEAQPERKLDADRGRVDLVALAMEEGLE